MAGQQKAAKMNPVDAAAVQAYNAHIEYLAGWRETQKENSDHLGRIDTALNDIRHMVQEALSAGEDHHRVLYGNGNPADGLIIKVRDNGLAIQKLVGFKMGMWGIVIAVITSSLTVLVTHYIK